MVNYSSFESLLEGLQQGNRFALAKAITLAESKLPEDHNLARQLIKKGSIFSSKSIRIGISGSPGVGKSTFIEALGMKYIAAEHKVAVLAVDPSSSIHAGSILGDKTRMNQLGNQANAFIRPSPSGTHLGGVQQKTRDSILLCEAAGFDVVIVETVGVGQSEISVSRMTDLFLLLIQPASGDELQGIKRGIVEMADMVIINKADQDRIPSAKISKAAYLQALHLLPVKNHGASVPVVLCSAVSADGLSDTWDELSKLIQLINNTDYLTEKRKSQDVHWFKELTELALQDLIRNSGKYHELWKSLNNKVQEGDLSPEDALTVFSKELNS